MNGAAVSWKSSLALSTAEAEYIALGSAVQEAIWIRQLLKDLNVDKKDPLKIYEDNQSAISMGKNPQFHGRSKHIEIKYHFLRDHIEKKLVIIQYCATNEMLADLLTKGISKEQFEKLRQKIGVVSEEQIDI